MSEVKSNRLNLYDYFGFPDRRQRDEAKQIFDVDKLRLITVNDANLCALDTYIEQYSAWSYNINNFSSHLGLHFLLMYYQHQHNPLDTIDLRKFQSPEGAHKIHFDTFAEDTSLYLVSYFDKHIEMFNELYDLKQQSGKRYNLSRKSIINEMQKISTLKELAAEYQNIEQSQAFKIIKEIRDNFVHNKSLSYYGMNVDKKKINGGIEYVSYNSKGISTEATYHAMCELIKSYEQLCNSVNAFFNTRIEEAKSEGYEH